MDKRKYMIEDLTRLEIAENLINNAKPYAYDNPENTLRAAQLKISAELRELLKGVREALELQELLEWGEAKVRELGLDKSESE